MQLISTIAALRERLKQEHSIAFIPTMGNLHEGHLNLMRQGRQHGKCVVASIFVNPLQFGPSEDFEQYPRTLEADCEKLADIVDVVFAPAVNEMYPVRQSVFVEPPPIADEWCGAARPGHFRGMATVVLKLLNIVQPQVALFGKKDYQQLHIIREMVAQLNLPVVIVGGETVRAADGLALSSRNQYLNTVEREEATFLHQTLRDISAKVLGGARDFMALQHDAVTMLSKRGWMVDYVAICNQSDLLPADAQQRDWVVIAAAKLGRTRLLDNVEIGLDA
ncbi:MAG: pantoate--beta-alanine ligase [Gallionella sp.]|nr:pantoate--beta-alanine ligase [Gallionella sp.]MDD4947237.1 pantoate--beta-alanine ligase [Gallionella sp.]MDD5612014.1 pantoate--beta-alanine ligase [Gallionella sp.]